MRQFVVLAQVTSLIEESAADETERHRVVHQLKLLFKTLYSNHKNSSEYQTFKCPVFKWSNEPTDIKIMVWDRPFENQTIHEPDTFGPFVNRTSPVFGWLLHSLDLNIGLVVESY